MAINVTATASVHVQVVLANFAPEGGTSVWDLSALKILRDD
jgi:hypothetical protein